VQLAPLHLGVQTILSAEEETAEEEEEDAKVAVAGMEFDGNAALILSTFALVRTHGGGRAAAALVLHIFVSRRLTAALRLHTFCILQAWYYRSVSPVDISFVSQVSRFVT
jgi:hypothetical protein